MKFSLSLSVLLVACFTNVSNAGDGVFPEPTPQPVLEGAEAVPFGSEGGICVVPPNIWMQLDDTPDAQACMDACLASSELGNVIGFQYILTYSTCICWYDPCASCYSQPVIFGPEENWCYKLDPITPDPSDSSADSLSSDDSEDEESGSKKGKGPKLRGLRL